MAPWKDAESLPRAYGTLNWGDVLGIPSSPFQIASPISSGGPNQSMVAPAFSGPGTVSIQGGPAPAFSILGMVLLLVAWRLAVEFGTE